MASVAKDAAKGVFHLGRAVVVGTWKAGRWVVRKVRAPRDP